jgi:hypothetical protein
MGKGLNRERRRQKQQRDQAPFSAVFMDDRALEKAPKHEATPATLRLVRPADEHIPIEPVATRRPGEVIGPVREPKRGNDFGGTEEGGHNVDTAPDDGADDAPSVVRSFDAEAINKVFNDPAVFPLIAAPGSAPIDVTPLLQDQRNILLVAEGGGVLFIWQEAGTYEAHNALAKARVALATCRWMFTHTDCMEILIRVPAINQAADEFCKLIGATKEFERKEIWQAEEGAVDMAFWSLQYYGWVRNTFTLKKSGQKLHQKLVEEYARLGHAELARTDEDCHELYSGVCFETILGGQLDKAVILYNRWARFAGYAQISLVSHDPPLIDIAESLLQITGDTFKVILVRK